MKVLFLMLMLMLCGCSVFKQQPIQREYLTMIEIRSYYGLKHKECREIVKAARAGSIDFIYHCGRDAWMYDANVDYSVFKTSKNR